MTWLFFLNCASRLGYLAFTSIAMFCFYFADMYYVVYVHSLFRDRYRLDVAPRACLVNCKPVAKVGDTQQQSAIESGRRSGHTIVAKLDLVTIHSTSRP